MSSITMKFLGESLVHASLWTGVNSCTQAQGLELELELVEGGALGVSFLDGKEMGRTLDGQRLLASSFLSALSSQPFNQGSISKSSVTIEEWWKASGKEGVKTKQQTKYSSEFTTSQLLTNAFLLHATSPPKKTWLTNLQRVYTH